MQYTEYEFIEVLEVIPVDGPEGDGIERIYTVQQPPITLSLSVFPYDGDVYVYLYHKEWEHPLMYFPIRRCKVCRSGKEITGIEFLEFRMNDQQWLRVYRKPTLRVLIIDD